MGEHVANSETFAPLGGDDHHHRTHYQAGAYQDCGSVMLPPGYQDSHALKHHHGDRGIDSRSPPISPAMWAALKTCPTPDEVLVMAANDPPLYAWLAAPERGEPWIQAELLPLF